MKRFLATLSCAAILTLPAMAQTNAFTPVSATNLTIAGVPIVTGMLTVTPVDSGGLPIPIRTADNKQYLPGPSLTAAITSGAIASGLQVPDQCTARSVRSASAIGMLVTVTGTANGKTYQSSFTSLPSAPFFCGSATVAINTYSQPLTSSATASGLLSMATVPAHCTVPSILTLSVSPYTRYTCIAGTFVADPMSTGLGSVTLNGQTGSIFTLSATDVGADAAGTAATQAAAAQAAAIAAAANASNLASGTVAPARLPVATTSAPGVVPMLPNDATKFLNGQGAYTAPPIGAGASPATSLAAGTVLLPAGASSNQLADVATISTSVMPQPSATSYYVNSLTGVNTNNGLTPAAPFADCSPAMGITSAHVVFYSGGSYRNSTCIPTASGITAGAYGPARKCAEPLGDETPQCDYMPTFIGSDVITTGWTSEGSGTYSTAYTADTDARLVKVYVTDGGNLQEIVPLRMAASAAEVSTGAQASVAEVKAQAGTIGVATGHLYVHLADGSSPAVHTLEVAARDRAFFVAKANNVTIDGIRFIRYKRQAAVWFDASSVGTGTNATVTNSVAYNIGLSDRPYVLNPANGNSLVVTLSDPLTGDTDDSPFLFIPDASTKYVTDLTVTGNIIGLRDTEGNTLDFHSGGITAFNVNRGTISGNRVRTKYGTAVQVGAYYYSNTTNKLVAVHIDDNQFSGSEGAAFFGDCVGCTYSNNRVRFSKGNGLQIARTTNLFVVDNDAHDLASAYSNGLYNCMDGQSDVGTTFVRNKLRRCSNNGITAESDSHVGASGRRYIDNFIDVSQNTTPSGAVPDLNNVVVPLYATAESLADGTTYGYGNILIPHPAVNYAAWWGPTGANDHTHFLSESDFATAMPGLSALSPRILSSNVITPAPTVSTPTYGGTANFQGAATLAITATAGQGIFVVAQDYITGTMSIADSLGGTPVLVATKSHSGTASGQSAMWYFANVAAGSHTFTETNSATGNSQSLVAFTVNGMTNSSPIDASASAIIAGGPTYSGPSVTTTGASRLVFGVSLALNAFANPGAGTGWTGTSNASVYQVVTSAGTSTPAFTSSLSAGAATIDFTVAIK